MVDKEMPLNITWSQFEACNQDAQSAFENMCRFLFNDFFFEGKAIFHSDPNNPGVEITPIFHEKSGKRISFQAKYLSSDKYQQIKHSAKEAVKYYAGELDAIYLYCNKDLTISSKQYQDICGLLLSKNISLIPITNQTILDQALNNDTVSWHYFNCRHLTSKWFGERLQLSLAGLGPRYNGDFNVSTSTETQLDIFLCNNSAVTQINNAKSEVVKRLKVLYRKYADCRELLRRILDEILLIEDISCATIADCLSWHKIVEDHCANDLSLIRNLITDKKRLFTSAQGTDDFELRNNLLREIHDLEDAIDILGSMGLGLFDCTLIQEKVFIVRGEAGVGKSQLLANAAEKLIKEGHCALLMLGDSFLSNDPVAIQITQQLEIDFTYTSRSR